MDTPTTLTKLTILTEQLRPGDQVVGFKGHIATVEKIDHGWLVTFTTGESWRIYPGYTTTVIRPAFSGL